MQQLTIRTSDREQYVEITHLVEEAVRQTYCSAVMVYVAHTTAGVFINENADPDVMRDLYVALARMVPEDAAYRHVEGNTPAHVKAILVGSSALVPVADGRLVLGTWQGIYFAEFDGPRNRHFLVVPLGSESHEDHSA
jgi:secondary thiamine-phosphate synthase enzyme